MPIWGWVCVGLVLAFVTLTVIGSMRKMSYQEIYDQHGTSSIGWIVQANSRLYEDDPDNYPAMILIEFTDGPRHPDVSIFRMAGRVGELKFGTPTTPDEEFVAALVRDEEYKPNVWSRLPDGFTGGREVYSMGVAVDRKLLPTGRLTLPFVRCRVLKGHPGTPILMVAYRPLDENLPMRLGLLSDRGRDESGNTDGPE